MNNKNTDEEFINKVDEADDLLFNLLIKMSEVWGIEIDWDNDDIELTPILLKVSDMILGELMEYKEYIDKGDFKNETKKFSKV